MFNCFFLFGLYNILLYISDKQIIDFYEKENLLIRANVYL